MLENAIDHFYCCVHSFLAFEWKWAWSWSSFDRNLCAFLMLTMLFSRYLVGTYIRKEVRFQTKQGQLQPHFHSKA